MMPNSRLAPTRNRPRPNAAATHPGQRVRHWGIVLGLLALCLFAAPRGFGQAPTPAYGPPSIAYAYTLFPFSITTTDDSGIPIDVYVDNYGNPAIQIPADGWGNPALQVYADGSLAGTGWAAGLTGVSYDYTATAGWGGAFAVAADKRTVLGVPAGVTMIEPDASVGEPHCSLNSFFTTPSGGTFSNLMFWNGNAWVAKFFGAAAYFTVDSSPWYWYDGTSDVVVDGTNGWPASDMFADPPPQQVYVNGTIYSYATTTGNQGSGAYYSNTYYYTGPLNDWVNGNNIDWVQITENAANGSSAASSISGMIGANNETFSTDFNADTWAFDTAGGVPGDLAISFSAPSGVPAHGPAEVSLNGQLLQCLYTTLGGTDHYGLTGVASTVDIDTSNNVTVNDQGSTYTGSYGPPFAVYGEPQLIGLDGGGNAQGLSAGVTLLFGSSLPGQQIASGDGSTATAAFRYARADGAWGLLYTSLPDGPFLVQDGQGNFTSPVYRSVAALGSTTVNAIGGWPATDLFPMYLYVNGIQCALDASSQYDSGGVLPRNGGASYHAPDYDLTVVLSWSWDTQFHGSVTGNYGQSSSFTGVWDGLNTFTSLTAGAIVSVTPPSSGPAYGPPQVTVNGNTLTYSGTSYGADLYQGSLGQTLAIYANNTVTFHGPGATPNTTITFSGTYNPATHQFTFGSGNTAVVTATDLDGHNLAASAGGTSAAGTTELAGSLDIRGNALTLGSWTQNGASTNGFTLLYSDLPGNAPPSLLTFSSTRALVNWNWNHPTTDAGPTQVTSMTLDATHRVLLYDPNNPGVTGIILDPSGGGSSFHGPVRAQPQGDISMGAFTSSPVIP